MRSADFKISRDTFKNLMLLLLLKSAVSISGESVFSALQIALLSNSHGSVNSLFVERDLDLDLLSCLLLLKALKLYRIVAVPSLLTWIF